MDREKLISCEGCGENSPGCNRWECEKKTLIECIKVQLRDICTDHCPVCMTPRCNYVANAILTLPLLARALAALADLEAGLLVKLDSDQSLPPSRYEKAELVDKSCGVWRLMDGQILIGDALRDARDVTRERDLQYRDAGFRRVVLEAEKGEQQ